MIYFKFSMSKQKPFDEFSASKAFILKSLWAFICSDWAVCVVGELGAFPAVFSTTLL